MGGAEAFTVALKHLAQQKQQPQRQRQRQQQRQQQIRDACHGMPTADEPQDAAADRIEALEHAWVCDMAYSQRHTLHSGSLTCTNALGCDRVPVFCVEGSDEQKQLEADSSLPPWPSELLEAHMSLVLKVLDIKASETTEFLKMPLGRVRTSHLTLYPWLYHCMCVFCGMGFKLQFLRQMLIAGNGVTESSKLMKLIPRAKLQSCIIHTIQAASAILKLERVTNGSACACASHALQLLSDVCSTADGLVCFQALHGEMHEMVWQMCEYLKCWDASLQGAVLKANNRQAASNAREGSSCTRRGAFSSVQKAGGRSGSSSTPDIAQQGDQGSSSSSWSSAAAKAMDESGGKSFPWNFAGSSNSASTSSSAQEQAHENGGSNDQAVGPKLQSRASQACVGCGKMARLKRCAHCGQALVCSEACQRAFWPTHKLVCKKGVLKS
ncbi:hypothetical protein DUNSADRAFT_10877 [Dunaliella salina]|uniref:MYND-type domain-containing protein n=1 Tax=Dunaliella salina TaxID=3046 RepID=A0ABQ7HA23_DUNSA|nr:hypothetical protein DUNSADRAFT_10877 [Dunaliella salina]|eukprot:KAF5843702.1 hypothetical protein DUNSADRAFT_10877 [Dunaliella salina]